MTVFDRLTGQREVVATLQAAVRGEGMTHAWLFTGPPGSGRSVAARAFAAALLCENAGCGECPSCRHVDARTHQNLVVVEPTGLSISVDDARRVVRQAAMHAAGGRTHVVVVEDADRLTEQAANAWLKAIEEPAEGTVFLLCAPSPEDLPPTIRSRCRQVTLRLPSSEDVAEVLARQGIDAETAHWAAAAAQGHVGRARALATDEAARAQRTEALKLPHRLATVGECIAAAADLVESADEAGREVRENDPLEELVTKKADLQKRQRSRETRARRDSLDRALVDLAAWYRDVLAVQLGATTPLVHEDQADTIRTAATDARPEATMQRIEAVLACREAIAANVTPLLAVEQLTLALRGAT